MALNDLATNLADMSGRLDAKIQRTAQQRRRHEQLQELKHLVDDLMTGVEELKVRGEQDDQRIVDLEARLAKIEVIGGSSKTAGRETAEIKQVRKNVAAMPRP